MTTDWKAALAAARLLPIISAPDADAAVALIDDFATAGITAVEILFRASAAPAALARARARHPQLLLAAGTILDMAAREAAIAAGADLLIAPGLTPTLAALCRAGPPLIPGAQTPSEVMAAREAGFGVLKFYPAEPNDAPAILPDYANVFADIAFVPTGGITEAALPRYAKLRNVIAVGGSWLHAGLEPGPGRATALAERVARGRALMNGARP